ncbi:DUF6542 domain-containing protein [Streptomyces sp. NRRL F-5755]|uniref:DUF6542 domain-containing protein n=1 Tax=Streptomyces sp. NRRL F-5755 TaxID=1519475 RepID=UPI0007C84E92|nr:DUF6542 domain-containing protein [Streptomyces sp. NRRL F-5755]
MRARRRGPLAPLAAAAARLPSPRLTGLGCGLLGTFVLFAFAFFDHLLFGDAPTAYGVFFVVVGVCTGLWVRPYDLITAPIALPIMFTLGTVPISHNTGGFAGLLMGVFTVLATQAGWLFAGTLACALIVVVRKAAAIARRQAERHAQRQVARAQSREPAKGGNASGAAGRASGQAPDPPSGRWQRRRGQADEGPGPGQRPGLAQGAHHPRSPGPRAGQVRDRPASRPAT